MESVVKRLHTGVGASDSATTGNFIRYLPAVRFVVSAVIDGLGGAPYFAACTLLVRLRPTDAKQHKPASANDQGGRRRGGALLLCGWSAKTLVVVADSEDDRQPVEQHYVLSEDGQRLVEITGIKGHMDKFTLSRVWDRTG